MKKNLNIFYTFSILFAFFLFLISCKSSGPSISKPAALPSVPVETVPEAKQGQEDEWARTVRAAKKEGLVIISTMIEPLAQKTIEQNMKNKFNISIEWRVGLSSETAAKVLAERKAGIYGIDVWTGGANTMTSVLKPAGALDPFSAALILPENKDKSAWLENEFPFLDKDKMMFSYTAYQQNSLSINTDLVKKEELTSIHDLLSPKWKEKIVMGDPTMPGSALKWFGAMTEKDYGPILGIDFMKKLVNQNPIIMRDRRLGAEWIIRGKYPLSLVMQNSTVVREMEMQGIKVPYLEIFVKEDKYLTSGYSVLGLMNKTPHPNAARVFINWLLSREGQTIYSKAVAFQSTRIDIPPPEELYPQMNKRLPGIKFINSEIEEYLIRTPDYIKSARDVFGPLLK